MTTETDISFADLGLSASILTALSDLGYENLHQFNNNVSLICYKGQMCWVWHKQEAVKQQHSVYRC